MNIQLIAVGTRMPNWVEQGFSEYAKRLPPEFSLNLTEIPAGKRGKHADIPRLMRVEGQRLLAAVPQHAHVVVLEVGGRPWSTEQLAARLQQHLYYGGDLALLVGGPDGLSPACRQAAHEQWSISPLTLPHPLVRVIIAEQIYRSWSILCHHPYHRD
jgi:23S rRNA (pseudouridine1915-N3)-methyltransferase